MGKVTDAYSDVMAASEEEAANIAMVEDGAVAYRQLAMFPIVA